MKTIWWPGMVLMLLAGCAASGHDKAGTFGGIAITVTEKGFEPARVTVPAGKSVTLWVTRRTDKTCAKEIVIADQGIRRDLPLDEAVEITFTPAKAGEIRYACGMDMLAGTIVVQ